jgi:putative hydrolase of the HAD superfamily
VDVRAVVLDYGGVLSLPQPAADLDRIERLAGVAGARLWPTYWARRDPYDRGTIGGAAFWTGVGADLGRTFAPERLARLVEADTLSWAHPNEPMLAWASALGRAGVRIGLLSNAPPELRDLILDRFGWAAGFDQLTFSCEVGSVKPEPRIYRRCLDGLGVAPAAVLFVDDRPDNVAAARRLGMTALRFTGVTALAAELDGRSGLPVPPVVAP